MVGVGVLEIFGKPLRIKLGDLCVDVVLKAVYDAHFLKVALEALHDFLLGF